jgi:hypothetical protein
MHKGEVWSCDQRTQLHRGKRRREGALVFFLRVRRADRAKWCVEVLTRANVYVVKAQWLKCLLSLFFCTSLQLCCVCLLLLTI